MTQPSEPSEKEMAPQQLRWLERIQNPNPNPRYVNAAILKDEVTELERYEQASQNTAWQQETEEETIAIEQNQTWELVLRPNDIKSISCKWVYEIICLLEGSIERYKAWTVAQGFSQQYGLDYDEMFSLVAKITIV